MSFTKEAFGKHLISLLAGNNITISENDKSIAANTTLFL